MRARCAAVKAMTTALAVAAGFGCSAVGDDARPTETGFPLAYFYDDCAPWDGLALTFMLTGAEIATPFDVSYPHLRVSLYRPPERIPGSSVTWTGIAHDDGYAVLCESEEACSTSESLEMRFARRQSAADVLEGEILVRFAGGRVVGGPFHARRIEFRALCG